MEKPASAEVLYKHHAMRILQSFPGISLYIVAMIVASLGSGWACLQYMVMTPA